MRSSQQLQVSLNMRVDKMMQQHGVDEEAKDTEVQNQQATSQNTGNKEGRSKEEGSSRNVGPLFTKKSRQTGNKEEEGVAYIHKRVGEQWDTGETHKGNYLRQEKRRM